MIKEISLKMGFILEVDRIVIIVDTFVVSIFEEECGDGFMCIFDQKIIAYGCAPTTNLTNTVCCSTGQGCENPGQG